MEESINNQIYNKNLPYNPDTDSISDDTLLKQLLRAAVDTSEFDVKTLSQKIDKILEVRLKNELMLSKLLNVGVVHDKIAVQDAAAINSRNKDSISELIKIKQLLDGLATERISVSESVEINEIRNRVFGHDE